MGDEEAEVQYRVSELAAAAAVPVRTVRYYQQRGLLAPPARRGRYAIYHAGHLERLQLIADLLARGHSLEGIADLFASAEQGGGVTELLGFETVASTAWSDDEIELELDQLFARFGEQLTAENMAEAMSRGFLRAEGDRFFFTSERLLDSVTTLVAAGIPLNSLLTLSYELEAAFDRIAFAFVQQFRTHLLGPVLDQPSPQQVHHLSHTLDDLRPVVRQVADELLASAMDRRIRIDLPEVSQLLSNAADAPAVAPEPPPTAQA